ncbi:hypothetical protein HDU76_005675, partial [Blyttiomyces sp. JEL0837]
MAEVCGVGKDVLAASSELRAMLAKIKEAVISLEEGYDTDEMYFQIMAADTCAEIGQRLKPQLCHFYSMCFKWEFWGKLADSLEGDKFLDQFGVSSADLVWLEQKVRLGLDRVHLPKVASVKSMLAFYLYYKFIQTPRGRNKAPVFAHNVAACDKVYSVEKLVSEVDNYFSRALRNKTLYASEMRHLNQLKSAFPKSVFSSIYMDDSAYSSQHYSMRDDDSINLTKEGDSDASEESEEVENASDDEIDHSHEVDSEGD